MARVGFKLKKADIASIDKILNSGKERAQKLIRCQILKMRHKGYTIAEIAASLDRSTKTVNTISKRYREEGLEGAINDRKRSGRPAVFSGKQRANITALACSEAPEGHSQWSLRLLADKAVELSIVDDISHTDVRRILKKTKSNRT